MAGSLIRLRWESAPRRRRRHSLLRVTFVLMLLVLGALLAERWRGQWALSTWTARMSARGEVFEPEGIWPQPSPQGLAFAGQWRAAVAQLPQRLNRYAGRLSPIVPQEPGMARRGSDEPSPILPQIASTGKDLATASWSDLELGVGEAQGALQSLRSLLKDPPADIGTAILPRLEARDVTSYVDVRRAAHAFQAAAICDLHRGALASAQTNLLALASISRVHSAEPTLVNYMMRMAVLNIGVETAWDALQADGWTERQLGALQQAFQCDQLLAQMPRTMEAERAMRLMELDWFSSHSYLAFVERYEEIRQCFGQERPDPGRCFYRQWLFHPVWRFAWADQEKLEYLRQVQQEIDILREGVKTGSGCALSAGMSSVFENYHPPRASWRLYLSLAQGGEVGTSKGPDGKYQYPYGFYTRAWSVSMRNLTLSEVLRTAIAVKRYELRDGKPPGDLEALAPEFGGKVPRDLMSGEALHYVLHADNSYSIYSVADNGRDDGGSAVPGAEVAYAHSPWNGLDWVWPRLVSR